MKDQKAEYDWEVLPYEKGGSALGYAIYADNAEEQTHAIERYRHSMVTISNQSDCDETFSFSDLDKIDEFMGRLAQARIWLASKTPVIPAD